MINEENDDNLSRLRSLVDELTIRDEKIFIEHDMYEKIINLVLDGIWIVNEKNKTTYVNDKMASMMGFLPEEMIGTNIYDYINDADKVIAEKNMENKNSVFEGVYFLKLKSKNGALVNVQISASCLFSGKKKYRGIVACVKEVTKIDIANYYKQILFDISLNPLMIVDFDGYIKEVNAGHYKMLGYNKYEMINTHYSDYVVSDLKSKSNEVFKELINGNELTEFENSLICKNGSIIKVKWRAKPDTQNNVIFASAIQI